MIPFVKFLAADDTGSGTRLVGRRLGVRMGLGVERTGDFCGAGDFCGDRVEITTGDGRELGAEEEEVELVITDGEEEDARVVAGVGVRSGDEELVITDGEEDARVVAGVGVRSGDVELVITDGEEDARVVAGVGVRLGDMELVITDGEEDARVVAGVGVRLGDVELVITDGEEEDARVVAGVGVRLGDMELVITDGEEDARVTAGVGVRSGDVEGNDESGDCVEVELVTSEVGTKENDGTGESQVEFASTGDTQSVGRLTVLASMVIAWRARSLPTIVEFEPTEIDAYAFNVPTKYELVFNVAELPMNQKTLQALEPLVRIILEPGELKTADPEMKIKTAVALP